MPLSKYLGRRAAVLTGKAVKKRPLSAAEKQKAAYAEMEAKLARDRAARAAAKKSPKPKTPSQIHSEKAAERRKRLQPPALGRLDKALTLKRKKT